MGKVAIVGLGYVGLPLALLCARKGLQVVGFDVDKRKIESLKEGKAHLKDAAIEKDVRDFADKVLYTIREDDIKDCTVYIVCVPTPVDDDHKPNLEFVEAAVKLVGRYVKNGDLVIIESTIFPGTMDEIVVPLFEEAALRPGKDFYLVYCPERIDPGSKQWKTANIPRVLAGACENCTKRGVEFYGKILDADITQLKGFKSAEATKIMENTFRDVNIAFVNEMARSFDKMGIDIIEVIKGASTKPFAFMPHYPGSGVGGHCISIDPYYMIDRAERAGFKHEFLALARKINEGMPAYTVARLEEASEEANVNLKVSSVTVLGLAYKGGVDDTRESPAFAIIDLLKDKVGTLRKFDPYCLDQSTVADIKEALDSASCVIVATNHPEFLGLKGKDFLDAGVKVVIDGRNCLDKESVKKEGIVYKGIGQD